MTIFAAVTGVDVGDRFADRFGAIVAAKTTSSDISVIDLGAEETHSRMASIALCGGVDMGGGFANRGGVVVARATGSDDFVVIDF